jgi:hypothetical protein
MITQKFSSLTRRILLAVLLMLALTSSRSAAQNARADVKRFQWDPVVVHLAAEATRGVEVYMSVHLDHWALTWFDSESVTAWLPQLRALQTSSAAADSTAWLFGFDGDSRLRVVKGSVQGREAFALQLRANPSKVVIQAWLPRAYIADFTKALEAAVTVARDVARAPAPANAQPIFEEWDVDEAPKPAAEEHFDAGLPQYALRGDVVVGFVVDSAGHVVPSTVSVYDCDDANIAKRWGRAVTAWHFVAGSRGGHHVASRFRMAFTFDTGGSLQVNPDRIVPGRP